MENLETLLKELSKTPELNKWQSLERANIVKFAKSTPPYSPVVAHIRLLLQNTWVKVLMCAFIIGLSTLLFIFSNISVKTPQSQVPVVVSTPTTIQTQQLPDDSFKPIPSAVPVVTDKPSEQTPKVKSNQGLHIGWDKNNK
jgi:hypothetical protein